MGQKPILLSRTSASPHHSLLPRWLCCNTKDTAFWKRGGAVGWKRFGAVSFNRLIQSSQADENIRFAFNADPRYLKDPHSKALEPDCPSPDLFDCDTVSREGKGNRFRGRKHSFIYIVVFLCLLFVSGCPKKVPIPSIEAPPVKDPMAKLLEAFSPAERLQAKASIRLDTTRKGEELRFLLNGIVIYEKPDKLRILGYHPFGMGVFDALYRGGEFVLFSPLQNRAYTGEISEFRNLITRANVRISTEKSEGSDVPDRVRIEIPEKNTRLDVKLKDISINQSLARDAFEWVPPEGVEIQPLAQFLKGRSFE